MKIVQPLSGSEIRARDKLDLLSQVEAIGKLAPEARRTANELLLGDLLKQLCKPKE